MAVLSVRKEVAALPAVLSPDTVYYVRRGLGFDVYITDNTGALVFRQNNTEDPLKSPAFTYTAGQLTSVTYADGSTKTLTYASGLLSRIDLVRGGVTYRKDFSYVSGVLSNIVEVVL